ncbi:unnamed protein product [Sphagnum balticum]
MVTFDRRSDGVPPNHENLWSFELELVPGNYENLPIFEDAPPAGTVGERKNRLELFECNTDVVSGQGIEQVLYRDHQAVTVVVIRRF